ncbi:hypothetical protein [Methylobacterium planeticum]|uniref:hypothetical protein n=1 Tax=Methylobacterium planeticum TaxID=2615211 RepID=UPI001782CF41|nr:hypothetical protein [Methylobacterium planeticum]
MDVFTAKTLVSAVLVFGIALFSLVSFQHFITEIVDDLRAARESSSLAPERDPEHSRRV